MIHSKHNNTDQCSILESNIPKFLTTEDLAKLAGFTDQEYKMMNFLNQPNFNTSWIYLDDYTIVNELKYDVSKYKIRDFYKKLLFPYYEEGVDYKKVLGENELVKSWWAKTHRKSPDNRKKFYIITGECYKKLLMSNNDSVCEYYTKLPKFIDYMYKYSLSSFNYDEFMKNIKE